VSLLLNRIAGPLLARELVFPEVDLSVPAGEPGLVGPGSVSWRVFANPVSLTIGGIAAVLLELGEPRVRSGVWEHSSFRQAPRERMRRTGLGAMITVFGPVSLVRSYTARVNAIHAGISGVAETGEPYRADQPELLRWVQATAAFGFVEAYAAFVQPLGQGERDLFYAEAVAGARCFGVAEPPGSEAECLALIEATVPRLGPSPVLSEFLRIVRRAAILPWPGRLLQPLIVRAATGLLPEEVRKRLGLHALLGAAERRLLRLIAQAVGKVEVEEAPWAQAARRVSRPAAGAQHRS
jgi:uncharacterized protein (DUF2236 family)